MSFGKQLRKYREENGLDQKDLAEIIGVSKQTISAYEVRGNNPTYNDFIQICNILKVDAHYFMRDELNYIVYKELPPDIQNIKDKYDKLTAHDKKIVDYILNMKYTAEPIEELSQFHEETKIYRLPVYEQKAAAGIGQLGRDNSYYMDDFKIDSIPNEATFAIRIKGNSMYNKNIDQIKDNAIVLVNPRESNFENKIAIVYLDGEIVCKRCTIVNDHVEFLSDNYEYQHENKDSRNYRECKVIGIVLGVVENNRFIEVK